MFAILFPKVDPIFLDIGGFQIYWYSIAYIVGIVLGYSYMVRLDKSAGRIYRNIEPDNLILYSVIGIILGGRVGYCLFYDFAHVLSDPMKLLQIRKGGMSFHGGLLGMIVALYIFSRRNNLKFLTVTDVVCCAAPIGLFFGRIANFVNQELYGRVSHVPWAVIFDHDGQPRHPSQIYEALLEGIALFAVMFVVYRKKFKIHGYSSGVFLIGYSLARMVVELVREPDANLGFIFPGISMGQILSAPLLILGVYLLLRTNSAGKR